MKSPEMSSQEKGWTEKVLPHLLEVEKEAKALGIAFDWRYRIASDDKKKSEWFEHSFDPDLKKEVAGRRPA